MERTYITASVSTKPCARESRAMPLDCEGRADGRPGEDLSRRDSGAQPNEKTMPSVVITGSMALRTRRSRSRYRRRKAYGSRCPQNRTQQRPTSRLASFARSARGEMATVKAAAQISA